MRSFQQDYGLPLRPGNTIDEDARRQLNDAAVAREFAPTTEFDRAENWPPQRPPYTRAEFQPEQVQGVLVAIAPVVGGAAIAAAGDSLTRALGIAVELGDQTAGTS